MFKYNLDNANVKLDVVIDAKEWQDGEMKVYESTKAKFNVIGFRKGHAPKKVIEQQFGDNVFFDDTLDYFVRKTLNDFLMENPKLEPVSYPKVTFESYTIEAGAKFSISFEIVPEIKLCKYTGIEFKKKKVEVKDKEIDHEIHHLLEEHAKFESVERESKLGDSVVIDFVGSIDGVEFEGGKAENYPLELGSHSFIDTFEDQLVGKKKGDVVDVNVTFPKDYQAEEYAGKKALFKTTVKDVREKVLPTLDDKFISDATEFETVEEYKKSVKAHIQSMKEKNEETKLDGQILDYIIEHTDFTAPKALVDEEVEGNVEQLKNACKMYNTDMKAYLEMMGTTLDDYKKSCEERAKKNVKARFILREIIDENKIVAEPQEIEQKLKTMHLSGEPTDHDRVYAENMILIEKVHALLKDKNKIIVE